MRLTQLKLSGFKSFVDPTTLQISRSLVGIVGPNGCGKSNVIDAVRWVLGESKASELRGENMQDVIFNGSGSRKPAGRASVELIFDNSLGRLAGAWGRYGEIAVKRVLSRDGQSVYTINGQTVRRKDVYDLFLGTGLGPRAYAIIGQGMISRVIESRPEELRVFLEEAAGVSKYRERRRETETRLGAARENLERVEDIRNEIGKRLETLATQAEVAKVYQDKTQQRTERQSLLITLRVFEAQSLAEKAELKKGELHRQLEGYAAQLARLELSLEQSRQAMSAAQDEASAAQAQAYETNSQIMRQEASDQADRQRRDSARARHEAAVQQINELSTEMARLEELKDQTRRRLEQLSSDLQAAQASLAQVQAELPPLVAAADQVRQDRSETQATRAAAEADQRNLQRQLEELRQRSQRLNQRLTALESEQAQLEPMDPAMVNDAQARAQASQAAYDAANTALQTAVTDQASAERRREEARSAKSQADAARSRAAAEHQAQAKLLAQIEARDGVQAWLASAQLTGLGDPIWASLQVTPDWQRAVEAALGTRLKALHLQDQSLRQLASLSPPPATVVFHQGQSAAALSQDSLAHQVLGDSPAAQAARGWLARIRTSPSLDQALAQRASLAAAEHWITPEGHLVSQSDVAICGQQAAEGEGLMSQRDAVALLQQALHQAEDQAQQADQALQSAEQAFQQARSAAEAARSQEASLRSQRHEAQMAAVRAEEKLARLQSRQAEITNALTAVREELAPLEQSREQAESALATAQAQLAALAEKLQAQAQQAAAADQALQAARAKVSAAQAALQTVQADQASQQAELARMADRETYVQTSRSDAEQRAAQAETEVQEASAALARSPLQQLQVERQNRDLRVASARALLDERSAAVRELDEQRFAVDQSQRPVRDALGEADRQLAGAQATQAQLLQQAEELQVDLDAIRSLWPNGLPPADTPKVSSLQAEVNRLSREIEGLGAVNLAALAELEQANERKAFLDAQALDLSQAVETLEDAIRKIDRESRALLQSTYDAVNANFAHLFPILFGGGEAKLVLTGEEILDAGVQVMAQPPGKRNSSIHLLSGGEKALTATALVFALFQLNPAPFCMLDEVDAPLDDPNTERLCRLVREMAKSTQFIFITHNKIAMELAEHLVGVTMQEKGVSRLVAVDLQAAGEMVEQELAA